MPRRTRPFWLAVLALPLVIACQRQPPETGVGLAEDLFAAQRSARALRTRGDVAGAAHVLAVAADRTAHGADRDVENGHIGVRAGTAAVLADLAAVRAALADTTGALAALDRFVFEAATLDLLDSLQRSPRFAALNALPQVAERTASLRAMRRWRGDSAFTSPYSDTIPVADRVSGLSLVWAELRYSFVGIGTPAMGDLDSAYRATIARVLAPMDTWEYYQAIERFMAVAGDNHTDVFDLPQQLRRHRATVPIDTRYVDGHLMVLRVRSAALASLGVASGQEVVELDGLSPDAFVAANVAPQLAVHTPQARDVTTYGWRLWQGELGTSIRVQLRAQDGTMKEVSVRRGGWTDAVPIPLVESRMLPDHIGYLALNTFGDPRVSALIDSALATLGELRGLIVDSRLNSGGSQDAGWHLLSQWLSTPYRQDRQFSSAYVGIWRAWGGGTVHVPMPVRVVSPDSAVHRTIPLVWLIGPRTASAAEGVAALVEQTGAGVTVGEPTFGSTGQPILIPLPGGGRARVRVEEERYNDGRIYTRRGIEPMIRARVTAEGLRAGRDEVLEAGISEVRRRAHLP